MFVMGKYRGECRQQIELLMIAETMTVWQVASYQGMVNNHTVRIIHQRPHLCCTKTPLLLQLCTARSKGLDTTEGMPVCAARSKGLDTTEGRPVCAARSKGWDTTEDKELTTNPDEEREICCLCCTRAATHYDFGACCSACCLCIGNTCRNGCIRGQICMDDCAQSCGICMHDCGDKVSCDGGIGDAVCECGKGINTGLSFLGAGIYTGFALLGQCCYEICSVQLLMHLSLPLCSMSIAISSVVLPYWAWGETNKIAVGLFKCCNFTEENRNSNHSECLLLSDCLSSDFKSHLVIKAASGLQITYIVLHGITILLVIISQQKDDYSYKPAARQLCNGFVVLLAVAICYIGVIVFLSGVIQSQHLKGGPPRLSINLAMISCVVYLSYAAVCFGQPKVLICVPTSTALVYLVIFMMTNKTVLIVVLVLIGLFILGTLIALLMKCRK